MGNLVAPFNWLSEGATSNPYPFGSAVQAICGRVGCSNHTELMADHYGTYEKARAKFSREGWKIGKAQAEFLCPTCVAEAKGYKKPKLALVETRRADEKVKLMAAPIPPAPTREQWNKITDALCVHYDEKAERYRGDYSDRKLGEEIGVGAAFVAEERNRRFGAHDRNEASDEAVQSLDRLRKAQNLFQLLEADVQRQLEAMREVLFPKRRDAA